MQSSFEIPPTCQYLIQQLRAEGIQDPNVLHAMANVPRHLFVGPDMQTQAYENFPLPIGYGQTISQPYIVAHMTELVLAGKKISRVLEVGTGCGYQAAILAQLADEVYSIERIEELYSESAQRLKDLNITHVHLKYGDGFKGWPEYAPFQGIIVTAFPDHVPQPLLQQLTIGGRLVIPIDDGYQQILTVVERRAADDFISTPIEPVRFVPMLTGKE